jgi:uncharacterized protein YggU (UPF0235/DUF167 family)
VHLVRGRAGRDKLIRVDGVRRADVLRLVSAKDSGA